MRADRRTIPGIFAAVLVIALGAPNVFAQGAAVIDDDDDDAPVAAPADTVDPNAATFGVGLRLRQTFLPKSILEAFVERAEGGHSNLGFGIEGIRRRGNLEISLGLEYESLEGDRGIWIDNDGAADDLEYEGFGWFTLDFTFAWHTELHEKVSLRYGGGAGIGIIRGEIYQTDQQNCEGGVGFCEPVPGAPRERNEDIPPVFPVVNILAGVQINPVDNVSINLEFGMRTIFYGGMTAAYFF